MRSSNIELPRDLIDWYDKSGFSIDGPQSAYILSQSASTVTYSGLILPLEPFHNFREIEEFSSINHTNKNVRIFIASDVDIHNLRILGSGRGYLFIGSGAKILNSAFEFGAKTSVMTIGHNAKIESSLIHTYSDRALFVAGPGVTTERGCNFMIDENSYIIIGSDSMLSWNIEIRTGDSHGIYSKSTKKRVNLSLPVIIEPHVWLGKDVSVSKGSRIGAGTVIGQKAVVSGVLARSSIYAGVPVKLRKSGTTWTRYKDFGDPSDESSLQILRALRDGVANVELSASVAKNDVMALLSCVLAKKNFDDLLLELETNYPSGVAIIASIRQITGVLSEIRRDERYDTAVEIAV